MSELKFFKPCIFSDLQRSSFQSNKVVCNKFERDIHFVLADNVLSSLDNSQVKDFLSPLSLSSSSFDSNFPDDVLLDFCKSRFIQQPSDLQIYSDNLSKFSKRLSSFAKSFSKSSVKPSVSSEVTSKQSNNPPSNE